MSASPVSPVPSCRQLILPGPHRPCPPLITTRCRFQSGVLFLEANLELREPRQIECPAIGLLKAASNQQAAPFWGEDTCIASDVEAHQYRHVNEGVVALHHVSKFEWRHLSGTHAAARPIVPATQCSSRASGLNLVIPATPCTLPLVHTQP